MPAVEILAAGALALNAAVYAWAVVAAVQDTGAAMRHADDRAELTACVAQIAAAGAMALVSGGGALLLLLT